MKLLTLVFCFLSLLFSANVSAAEEMTNQEAIKNYTFSIPTVPIIKEVSESYWKLVNEELNKVNISLTFLPTPIRRALLEVDKGNTDGDTGRTLVTLKQSALKRVFALEEPIAKIKLKAFLPHDSPYSSISDLPKKVVIGNLQGDALSAYALKKKTSVMAGSYDQLIEMLKRKRIDIFLAATLDDIPLFNTMGFQLKALEGTYLEQKIFPILNEKHKGSIFEKELTKAIARLNKEGAFERVKKSFLKELTTKAFISNLYAFN